MPKPTRKIRPSHKSRKPAPNTKPGSVHSVDFSPENGTALPETSVMPSRLKSPPPGFKGIHDLWFVKAGELQSNPANWRKHPQRQREALQSSISANGWAGACLYNLTTQRLVDGHARKDLDPEQYVPVLVGEFTEQQEKSILATFDPISALANSNDDLLKQLTDELLNPTTLAQLSAAERAQQAGLERLLGSLNRSAGGEHGKLHIDEYDPHALSVPEHPVTKLGDTWEFPSVHSGSHWLVCGDATQSGTYNDLLHHTTLRPVLLVTSPPYWVGKDYEKEKTLDALLGHIQAVCRCWCTIIDPQGRIIINTMSTFSGVENTRTRIDLRINHWQAALEHNGWLMRGLRIWAKEPRPFLSNSPAQDLHGTLWEFLATFYNPKHKLRPTEPCGEEWRYLGVWNDVPHQRIKEVGGHPAPYPITIPARFITMYSKIGQGILEPYAGSGSTLLAAEQLKRISLNVELNPGYCDLIAARWNLQAPTERKAILHSHTPVVPKTKRASRR